MKCFTEDVTLRSSHVPVTSMTSARILIIVALACAALGRECAAQQVDLVSAKHEQEARLEAMRQQLDAAKTDAQTASQLQQEIDAIHAEDLWAKTQGERPIELHPGDGFHPFNFAVLSDLHLSERQGPQRLDRALELIAQRRDIAFVLVLGDIVWDKPPEQLKSILERAAVPVHLVYGNNDWQWVKDGSYEAAFGPRDYTFTYCNCTFIQM